MSFASHEDFVRSLRSTVRAYDSTLSTETVDLVVAFFAHETGFGHTGAAKFSGHNYGNVTAAPDKATGLPLPGVPFDVDPGGDTFYDASTKTYLRVPMRYWARYGDDLAGVTAWFGLLEQLHPDALELLRAGQLDFIAALHKGTTLDYFTAPVDHYLNGYGSDPGYLAALDEVRSLADLGGAAAADIASSSGEDSSAADFIVFGVALVALAGGIAVFFALR